MFSRVISISLAGFFLITFLWVYHLCFIRENDYLFYQTVQNQKASQSEPIYSLTQQTRKNTTKDIWLTQDNHERLHHKICAQSSLLTVIPKHNKFEVLESLNDITCWMQDKLYETADTHLSMQQVRLIEAKEGSYRYHSQEFNAQNVHLSLFRLPGHHLENLLIDKQKAFLRGIAQNVVFSISEKSPHFEAQQFKATFIKNE